MTYEIYRTIAERERYFKGWDEDQLNKISAFLKEEIYSKYVEKCKTLQRDSFTCQNAYCKHKDISLTVHHVKAKRNGGKDKARNLVTLCDTCHKAFESGSKPIVFADNANNLPSHMRGNTFVLHKEEKIDWKIIKARTKELRKSLKHSGFNFRQADIKIIMMLLNFLDKPFDNI